MRIAFISAAVLATSLANGATPIDGWYSSVFGGYTYLPNNINQTFLGVKRTDAIYRSGYDAGGSLGYKSNPLRYEGEITYLYASLKQIKARGISLKQVSGYSNGIFGMANVYYDFQGPIYAIQPFLGVGIGYGWVSAKAKNTIIPQSPTFSGSNSVFAYQATGGLTYNFSENYALNVGYRYIITTRAAQLGKYFQANLANLGVIYRFDGNRYT